MLSAIRFYELYTAISLHVKGGSYDFFKYGGKTSVSEASFFARKDRWFFEKMASKFTSEDMAIDFIVANFLKGAKYIRSFNFEDYQEFVAYRDALDYRFAEDCKQLKDKGGNFYDTLLNDTFTNQMPMNFMVILNIVTKGKLIELFDKKDNIIWHNELRKKVLTYSPFLVYTWQIIETRQSDLLSILKENK